MRELDGTSSEEYFQSIEYITHCEDELTYLHKFLTVFNAVYVPLWNKTIIVKIIIRKTKTKFLSGIVNIKFVLNCTCLSGVKLQNWCILNLLFT